MAFIYLEQNEAYVNTNNIIKVSKIKNEVKERRKDDDTWEKYWEFCVVINCTDNYNITLYFKNKADADLLHSKIITS